MNSISFFKALLMKELNEKDLPGNQEKIAGAAEPKDKITAADFAALRAKNEGEDHEVSMAQNSLKSIISSASQLMNMLGQDEKDIPAWIQDHITNAENYINQASKNYHEYHNSEHDMDELPDGTIEEPAGDAEDLHMKLQSIMEAKSISLKDFSKNLQLYKKEDITKSQLITSYNKLSAKDQDKAKELAKDLDVLPSPKKINETSLKSMMENVIKRKKAK
jgi:sialic acid synthase SpsE